VNPAVTTPSERPVGRKAVACADKAAMDALAAVATSEGVGRVAAGVAVTVTVANIVEGEAISMM